jgi:hypothetical protein
LISTYRILKLDPHLSLCTKINSKWKKSLNIKPRTSKLQEAAANSLEQIDRGKTFETEFKSLTF